MFPFRHRFVVEPGLRDRTGSLAITRGVFRTTTFVDPLIACAPLDSQRFALLHEEAHVRQRHGLLALILLPFRRPLGPIFESLADRYAIKILGVKRAKVAMREIYPRARSHEQVRLHGATWLHRLARAGVR